MIIDLIFISGVTAEILDANICFLKPNSVLAGINNDLLCLVLLLVFHQDPDCCGGRYHLPLLGNKSYSLFVGEF